MNNLHVYTFCMVLILDGSSEYGAYLAQFFESQVYFPEFIIKQKIAKFYSTEYIFLTVSQLGPISYNCCCWMKP